MKPSSENWLKIAEKDLKIAKLSLKAEEPIFTVFHMHAAIEKILKGLAFENGQSVPRSHNLKQLAKHPKFYFFDTGILLALRRRTAQRLESSTKEYVTSSSISLLMKSSNTTDTIKQNSTFLSIELALMQRLI